MKLFELLASFSSDELRGAKKAVQSPLLTTNQRLEQLFDVLRKMHPDFPDTDDYKKKLFKKIFPKERYNDYKLRRLFTELREVLEDYLLYAKSKKESHRRDVALTKIYGERNLYEIYKKKTEQLVQKIEKNLFPDSQLLLDKAVVMKDFYGHNGTSKLQEYQYLVKAMEAMHLYYMGERMTTKLIYQTLNKTWSSPLMLPFEKELQPLELLFSEEESLNYLIYGKIWELGETDNEAFYEEIRLLFETNIERFTKTDKNAIFHSLTNYCIKKMNEGNKHFSNHLFDLYGKGLEAKIIMNDSEQTKYMTYKNIAIAAIRLKKFEWVENFIENYEKSIEPDFREETKSYVNGCLYFMKKEFQKSVDLLSSYHFKNVNDIFTVKSILLRAYFEMFIGDESYYSLFLSYNNAYYKYLSRSNISESKKVRHQKLVSFTKRIASELSNSINFNAEKWVAELDNSEDFAFKAWCRGKLRELKERK